MIQIEQKTPTNLPTETEIESYADFLVTHLEEYGDQRADILKALHFSLGMENKPGGFLLIAKNTENRIVGITVILDTLMADFIPEHILVYIATDAAQRGQGIGRKLIEAAIAKAKGSIALHVEPQNPAKKLYEKLGFENKYLEMRLTK